MEVLRSRTSTETRWDRRRWSSLDQLLELSELGLEVLRHLVENHLIILVLLLEIVDPLGDCTLQLDEAALDILYESLHLVHTLEHVGRGLLDNSFDIIHGGVKGPDLPFRGKHARAPTFRQRLFARIICWSSSPVSVTLTGPALIAVVSITPPGWGS